MGLWIGSAVLKVNLSFFGGGSEVFFPALLHLHDLQLTYAVMLLDMGT